MFQHNINREQLHRRMMNWEEELVEKGYIEDESPLLQALQALNEQEDPKDLSQLLSIAASSRLFHEHHDDGLVKVWMEKAYHLDQMNDRAKKYFAQSIWKEKKFLLENIMLPTIRETDNRQMKKQVAKEIIEICDTFLNSSEIDLEELAEGHKNVEQGDEHLRQIYNRLTHLLKDAIEEMAGIRKVAAEFEQTISGTFYNTTYFFDMKAHLANIEVLKEDWKEQFVNERSDSLKSPLVELDEMVGLHKVKQRVKSYYQFLKYQKQRAELGFQINDELSLNMILTGNPGTGKTTLVRLLARIYHELGVLPSKEVIETNRSQLVGTYVGQTEENVRKMVEKALGGVLFIDEAYSLKREGQGGNDYGQAAIDTLVSLMTGEEFGGQFAVVLAGYPEEMRSFLDANPGLRSRFPQSNFLVLEDYDNDELLAIAERFATDNDYLLTMDGKVELLNRFEMERVDDTFGNARTARNIVLDAIFKKGSRLENTDNPIDYSVLGKEDFVVEDVTYHHNSIQQLDDLIGLQSVKDEVQKIIAFVKMQQHRREKNLPVLPLQLHSVFVGNPGTGKTTVAKIYANALKECGLLKRGHLIITSRADFVAGYVGQTAIKTKKKIREALGGVLFIDEAYSLLSQSAGDFGKEVIDTMVDEMTRHNENLVIILAGYPKEMDSLLSRNPGLKSRFKKYLQFPDYSTNEIIEIMELYGSRYQYYLTQQARQYLLDELSGYVSNGNGRFATNLMDEAIQIQAIRIMKTIDNEGTSVEATSIILEDIKAALERVKE